MRYGLFLGFGYIKALIFLVIVVVTAFILLLILIGYKRKRKYTQKELDILENMRQKYVRGEISFDEYRGLIEKIK
jgi:uncharacterized membrane protein